MILIALGANLPSRFGEPLETIAAAVARLDASPDIKVFKRSPVYVSAPVPISDQPWYHNAVVAIETTFKPFTLLAVLHEIEIDFGRVRGERNAARTLDLDIVAYDGFVMDEEGLQIPHPRMSERAFVLLPLHDIAPEWKHPVSGLSVAKMIDGLPDGQNIQKIGEGCGDAA